jgi:hypothetical protein
MPWSVGKKLTFPDPPNFQLPLFRIQRQISSVPNTRATSDAVTVLKSRAFSEYLESVQRQNTVGSRPQKHRVKSFRMNTCAKIVGGYPAFRNPLFRQGFATRGLWQLRGEAHARELAV